MIHFFIKKYIFVYVKFLGPFEITKVNSSNESKVATNYMAWRIRGILGLSGDLDITSFLSKSNYFLKIYPVLEALISFTDNWLWYITTTLLKKNSIEASAFSLENN